MRGVIPYPYYKELMKLRRIAYAIVIIFGLLLIFCDYNPFVAHADILGKYIPDVYDLITENIEETNDILSRAFAFSKTSPYDIMNRLFPLSDTAIAVRDASKTVALVVATLLIMVDFFRKTINFEWSSKWENILIFLIKIIVIKQVVQNADTIVGYIYGLFDYINAKAISGSDEPQFLPYGTAKSYTVNVEPSIIEQITKPWWQFWVEKVTGTPSTVQETYSISQDAVKIFYPNASFPSVIYFDKYDEFTKAFPPPNGKHNFNPTLESIWLRPYFLVLKAIAYIIFVAVIGRVFELTVYTLLAPLPLATFASETTHDVAKNFIKNYIAVVLQVTVIVVMFIVYLAINSYIPTWVSANGLSAAVPMSILTLFALGLGIMKSGTWSKKICGVA